MRTELSDYQDLVERIYSLLVIYIPEKDAKLSDYEDVVQEIDNVIEMHITEYGEERKYRKIDYNIQKSIDINIDDKAEELNKKVNKVGRPRLIDADDRKIARQERLKAEKYSTKYYNEHKSRVLCQYCSKEINSLAKSSHYKSRSCKASQDVFREEPRILTSRLG